MIVAIICLLVAATTTAAIVDVRVRRIPNGLTGGLALVGLLAHAMQGVVAFAVAIAAMIGIFVLGTLAFQRGWFGGGDVKLLAAAGGLVSFPNCIALIVCVLATGAVFALASAAWNRRLPGLLRSTIAVAAYGSPTENHALPYGVSIAGGSIAYATLVLSSVLRFS